MTVADGFQVKLVASEPDVRQPVTMTFDDRGRIWVIQYLQYPNPAGLKPVKQDQFLRTIYDKLPEPPPRGPIGADKITILDDPDGDGRFQKVKDFVTGLNLASGMALGHGGVFVAQPPYLLFYPDRNGDDVPDGDPEVLLTGFGMEDAHAFPNSLQWGPDGWLYGAQGSTVTAYIRGITFQQGIWRYHPLTKEFELFVEGGGNTWGLDFDRHGNLIAGTNWGGYAMLHQVQGAYYLKNFGKHGELQNPHAYGYFEHVPYKGFKGGHVTCGGIVYQGGALPKEFNNLYIAGNLLSNAVYWHTMEPKGSSFTARFGGDLLLANDPWFRPVDCLAGPDGAVYVVDWHDKRAGHLDPVDNWDRSNGRIYKIEAKGAPPVPRPALAKLSSMELLALLNHPNDWYVREARRLLAERRDPAVIPALRKTLLDQRTDALSLQALWALYVSGGFNDELAETLLSHPNPDVRAWTVRLLGDATKVSPGIQARLESVARSDSSCTVRNQLACTCKRLPAKDALPIIRELLQRDEDAEDPQIPLLLWWAIEGKAIADRKRVLALLESPSMWRRPIVRGFVLERLARRYLAEEGELPLAAGARLLAAAPGPAEVELLVRGMDKALEGRHLKTVPRDLAGQVDDLWRHQSPPFLALSRLAIRLGNKPAYQYALQRAADRGAPAAERIGLVEVLSQNGNPDCVAVFLRLLDDAEARALRLAALSALQPFADPRIPERVLALYARMTPDLRARAQTLLSARPASTRDLLAAVEAGRISPKEVSQELLHRISLHQDETIQRLLEKHWGKIGQQTPGEKVARMRVIQDFLRKGKGDVATGKLLYQKHCGTCHTLFGEGTQLGPDLTTADRKDLQFLLSNIVDPSAVMRTEYAPYVVTTKNGRLLTGLIANATPKTVTLLDGKNERTLVARDDIEEMKPSPQSLMPEKLLDTLEDQEIRDLFSYLQAAGPKP